MRCWYQSRWKTRHRRQDRVKVETRVLHAGIYAREIAHRQTKKKRKSFRSVTV